MEKFSLSICIPEDELLCDSFTAFLSTSEHLVSSREMEAWKDNRPIEKKIRTDPLPPLPGTSITPSSPASQPLTTVSGVCRWGVAAPHTARTCHGLPGH